MILIADSGSTKTDWCMIQEERVVLQFQSQGMNPFAQDAETLHCILENEVRGRMEAPDAIETIYFYGAGCTTDKTPLMTNLLITVFPKAYAAVASDLLGAARALCGNKEGIACILGTGSNSCLYDGEQIREQTPPWGYLIGDEGSGAVLGKRLVGDLLKGLLPDELKETFLSETGQTQATLIHRIYREPLPNRFLAGFAPFLHRHRQHPAIHRFLVENFQDFFKRNIVQYNRTDLPLQFAGSIAHYFQEELSEAAKAENWSIGKIEKTPMKGLVNYHLTASYPNP